jgi:hypothetical protein
MILVKYYYIIYDVEIIMANVYDLTKWYVTSWRAPNMAKVNKVNLNTKLS